MGEGEGEHLHSERRKKFWRILGALAAIGFVTGAVGQFAISYSESGHAAWPSWAPFAGSIGVIVVAIAVAYGSWRFFVSVDEVEVADNLWGCLIGFYLYAILFPAWWALNKLGQVPEVNDWAVFVAAMLSSLAVYGYRKVRFG